MITKKFSEWLKKKVFTMKEAIHCQNSSILLVKSNAINSKWLDYLPYSLFLTWLLATCPSNGDHVLTQVGHRKQNFFLSVFFSFSQSSLSCCYVSLIPILQKNCWGLSYPLLHQTWTTFRQKATKIGKSPCDIPSFQMLTSLQKLPLFSVFRYLQEVDFLMSSSFL